LSVTPTCVAEELLTTGIGFCKLSVKEPLAATDAALTAEMVIVVGDGIVAGAV
jgi:hypothetical protein